jgi:hypothetical protein
MHTVFLYAVLALTTLVLRSGDRIDVDGPIREQDGVVTFRSGGQLYSMPAEEIDRDATAHARLDPHVDAAQTAQAAKEAADDEAEVRKLRLSPEERAKLFDRLKDNHAGTPATAEQLHVEPAPRRTASEKAAEEDAEWTWRQRARSYQDAVVHAQEEIQLLESRAAELRSAIQFFFTQGYKPWQFTWESSQLEYVEAQLPRARLELTRVERELARFEEDARRQGVMPGWLR